MTTRLSAAEIEPTYENVVANCPACGRRNVYNRATDIGHFRAISNARVTCLDDACRRGFDVVGDLINPGHEMLLLDAWSFFQEKRYIQAVLSSATAYELFFAQFLRVELIYRPDRRDTTFCEDDIQWLNDNSKLLVRKTQHHAFEDMRRLFLRVALDRKSFTTREAAANFVASIPKRPTTVSRREVEAVADLTRRSLLLRVVDAQIAQLRNKVVHKDALRPKRDVTEAAITDAYETLFAVGAHFNIMSTDLHLNEPREDAAL